MISQFPQPQLVLGPVKWFPNRLYQKCPLCRIHPSNVHANSTPRDAIFTYCGGEEYFGIFTHFRSFRTSGSYAEVYFWIDGDFMFQLSKNLFFAHCGIHVVRSSIQKTRDVPFYHNKIRFFFFEEFLISHPDSFDRLLLTDLGDTVFQGDPFITDFRKDTLYVFHQETPIRELLDYKWVLVYASESELKSMNNCSVPSVNSGTIVGGSSSILVLLGEMTHRLSEHWAEPNGAEQGLYEVLVHSGWLIQHGVQVQLLSSREFPMGFVAFFLLDLSPTFGSISVPSGPRQGELYVYLHAYYHYDMLRNSIIKECPPINRFDRLKFDTSEQDIRPEYFPYRDRFLPSSKEHE